MNTFKMKLNLNKHFDVRKAPRELIDRSMQTLEKSETPGSNHDKEKYDPDQTHRFPAEGPPVILSGMARVLTTLKIFWYGTGLTNFQSVEFPVRQNFNQANFQLGDSSKLVCLGICKILHNTDLL